MTDETRKGVSDYVWPLDLENYTLTRDASTLSPGDVVIYTGRSPRGRRYVPQDKRGWLLRVTRTESQNVYGTNVYPSGGWAPDEEFVVVDGQIEHHGVYVIRRGES